MNTPSLRQVAYVVFGLVMFLVVTFGVAAWQTTYGQSDSNCHVEYDPGAGRGTPVGC